MNKFVRVLRKYVRILFKPLIRAKKAFRIVLDIPSRLGRLELSLSEHRLESRVLYGALALPSGDIWRNKPVLVEGAPGVNAFPCSTGCRQDSFEQPWFSYWTSELHVRLLYHRKLWEYIFILQALWERGALRDGARGLGFGVGTEPLSALFASRGCEIVATDMASAEAADVGWAISQQHAANKEQLWWPDICPRKTFDENVKFTECDMNSIPAELAGFDFCWSSCALEHLGSIEHGLVFIENSIACLKPGGWAVHTTEFNIQSNDETVDNRETVIFRRRDFEELEKRLLAKGHRLAPLDFNPGFDPIDNYVDVPPYRNEPCLRIALFGFSATSFGLIVHRGA